MLYSIHLKDTFMFPSPAVTSGVWTTHYMGLREIRPNQLYVIYDLGFWGRPDSRIMGCTIDVSVP